MTSHQFKRRRLIWRYNLPPRLDWLAASDSPGRSDRTEVIRNLF